jgi:hypothetical protein
MMIRFIVLDHILVRGVYHYMPGSKLANVQVLSNLHFAIIPVRYRLQTLQINCVSLMVAMWATDSSLPPINVRLK